MYTKFYDFSEKPFNLTPDPKFLYLTPSHREALASMIYGIKERRGFISITGEVGTGKTTLIYTLLNNLDEKVDSVFIYQTNITFEQLLKNILFELNIRIGDEDKTSLLRKLNVYLIQKLSQEETLTVIIDEAQNLPKEVMEELRILSNLETSKSKLLQILFVGQPELEVKLNSEDLRQLKQRIGIRRQIRALTQEESEKYIDYRLKLVGSSSSKVFDSEAISLISSYAKGIPRTINILCDNAFLIGYSTSKKKINAHIIREVISDMESSIIEEPIEPQSTVAPIPLPSTQKIIPFYNKAAILILSLLCIGLLALLGREYLQGTTPQADDIKYDRSHYAMKLEEDKRVKEEYSKSSFNSTPSLSEVKTDHISKSSIHTTPITPDSDSIDSLKPFSNVSTPPTASEEEHKVKTDRISDSTLKTTLIESDTFPVESPQPVSDLSTSSKTSEVEHKIRSIITVEKGYCISYLALKYYRMTNETVVDLIFKENPQVTNVHLIKINQRIKIPEITEESLITKLPDNTYKIHLGTFHTPGYAQLYLNEPTLKGKEVNIIPIKVSPRDTWYRVMLEKFDTKEESLETIKVLKQKGLLPSFGNHEVHEDTPS